MVYGYKWMEPHQTNSFSQFVARLNETASTPEIASLTLVADQSDRHRLGAAGITPYPNE